MDLSSKIDDKKYYNIKEIFDHNLFYWYADYGGIFRTVVKDYKNKNLLGTIAIKHNSRNTYRIKGSNIRKYIQLMIDRKL